MTESPAIIETAPAPVAPLTGVCAYCHATRPMAELHLAKISRGWSFEQHLYCIDKPHADWHQLAVEG